MGLDWPKEWACKEDGYVVTFAEIKAERIAQQRKWLELKLKEDEQVRAAQVWTFFVPGLIYGGWHLYLRTIEDSWWIQRYGGQAEELMTKFPCGMLPMKENFYAWKKAFAKTYPRPGLRQQGIVNGWVRLYKGHPSGEFIYFNNINKKS